HGRRIEEAGQRCAQPGGEPYGPSGLPGLLGDEVVADLDHRMAQAARGGMRVEGMADPVSGAVGGIAPDLPPPVLLEVGDQPVGEAAVPVVDDADVPWPVTAQVARREAVDADHGGRPARRQTLIELAVDR